MPSMQADLERPDLAGTRFPGPDPVDWRSTPSMSDDECLALLAKAVEAHDPESLEAVAWLIGRLAVPLE
jgi:hypothetical protein